MDYPDDPPILAIFKWATNADLILAAHKLGYLEDDWLTLDMTFGKGVWWKRYRPKTLITNDLKKGSPQMRFDFCRAPFADNTFKVVAYDPPYKLNGTPNKATDEPYGVEVPTRWQDRMDLIYAGVREGCRVTSDVLLVKCQDQVCSGNVRWQTHEIYKLALECGMYLEDELHMEGGRPQPKKNPDGSIRRQVHARRNFSTLMVFRKA